MIETPKGGLQIVPNADARPTVDMRLSGPPVYENTTFKELELDPIIVGPPSQCIVIEGRPHPNILVSRTSEDDDLFGDDMVLREKQKGDSLEPVLKKIRKRQSKSSNIKRIMEK
jgi:hypothetical protein